MLLKIRDEDNAIHIIDVIDMYYDDEDEYIALYIHPDEGYDIECPKSVFNSLINKAFWLGKADLTKYIAVPFSYNEEYEDFDYIPAPKPVTKGNTISFEEAKKHFRIIK